MSKKKLYQVTLIVRVPAGQKATKAGPMKRGEAKRMMKAGAKERGLKLIPRKHEKDEWWLTLKKETIALFVLDRVR